MPENQVYYMIGMFRDALSPRVYHMTGVLSHILVNFYKYKTFSKYLIGLLTLPVFPFHNRDPI